MPVKNYYAARGRIIGEGTQGGPRLDYLTDALGSVTAVTPAPPAAATAFRHKPNGERLAKVGSGSDPSFGWVGSLGYRETKRPHAERYMQARHFHQATGRWSSVDPLWPREHAYGYVGGNPVNWVDPSGLEANPSIPMDAIVVEMNPFINQDWFGEYHHVGDLYLPGGQTYATRVEFFAGTDKRSAFQRSAGASIDREYAGKSRLYMKYYTRAEVVGRVKAAVKMKTTQSEIRSRSSFTHMPSKASWDAPMFAEAITSRYNPDAGVSYDECSSWAKLEASGTADFWKYAALGIFNPAGDAVSIDFNVRVTFRRTSSGVLGLKIEGMIESFPDYEFIVSTQRGARLLPVVSGGRSRLGAIHHVPARYRGKKHGGDNPRAPKPFHSFPGLREKKMLPPITAIVPSVRIKCCC